MGPIEIFANMSSRNEGWKNSLTAVGLQERLKPPYTSQTSTRRRIENGELK